MSEKVILKLGSRPMNEAALAAGFQLAKGAGLSVQAYFLEDEALLKASHFSFSNEVQLGGQKRCLEVHELRRETKIAQRLLCREVAKRSEAAQIPSEFETLNGNGMRRLMYKVRRPNIMVLGEHMPPRLLAKDFERFRHKGKLQGVLMAGPRAKGPFDGPLAVIVHSLEAWQMGLPLLSGYLAEEKELIVFCLGEVYEHRFYLSDGYEGEVRFERLKRCDHSRLLWMVEREKPGLLFAMPGAPYLATEKDVEALLRLLACPIFAALAKPANG